MGFLLIGKIKVLTFFRVALSDFYLLRVVLRLVLRPYGFNHIIYL